MQLSGNLSIYIVCSVWSSSDVYGSFGQSYNVGIFWFTLIIILLITLLLDLAF